MGPERAWGAKHSLENGGTSRESGVKAQMIDVSERFEEICAFVLDIVDDKGIFRQCYEVVTPAVGASALQALVEMPRALEKLSAEFNRRVENEPLIELTISDWMSWPTGAETTGSLPFLLYFAFRSTAFKQKDAWIFKGPRASWQC